LYVTVTFSSGGGRPVILHGELSVYRSNEKWFAKNYTTKLGTAVV
jgi:hypothetical protein